MALLCRENTSPINTLAYRSNISKDSWQELTTSASKDSDSSISSDVGFSKFQPVRTSTLQHSDLAPRPDLQSQAPKNRADWGGALHNLPQCCFSGGLLGAGWECLAAPLTQKRPQRGPTPPLHVPRHQQREKGNKKGCQQKSSPLFSHEKHQT